MSVGESKMVFGFISAENSLLSEQMTIKKREGDCLHALHTKHVSFPIREGCPSR